MAEPMSELYCFPHYTGSHVNVPQKSSLRKAVGSNSIDYFPGWNSREPISAAINGIDFDERFILILRSIGDFSYDELAEISGLSKRDVRTKIARAREELQSRLAELSGQKQNELRTKKSQSSGPELISGR